jgi:hypothetical protein
MTETNTPSLLIRASHPTSTAVLERPLDESDNLYYCDLYPNASGLQEIYMVVDEVSGGRLDGPSCVPMKILGPLLNQLSNHGVEELRIATEPGTSPTSDAPGTAANPAFYNTNEFEEHIDPSTGTGLTILAFLLSNDKDADDE